MHRLLAILYLSMFVSARADEHKRLGEPRNCYLYSWGKGPNWITSISTEFRLSLLAREMPRVDDQYFEPTDKALIWVRKENEPVITTLASVDGKKVIQVVYPEQGSFGKTIGMILVAIETSRESGWHSPFFAAQPELYRGQFVNGKDVKFGYVATLEWSGTGSMRSHYLFDLQAPHPKIVATCNAGRLRPTDYKNETEYAHALKIFDREAELLSGTIPTTQGDKK